MPEKHGLEVTTYAGSRVGFDGIKVNLAINLVKSPDCMKLTQGLLVSDPLTAAIGWIPLNKVCHATFCHCHYLPTDLHLIKLG